WTGDVVLDTGEGEDALARYVAALSSTQQMTPLGTVVSYNNAAFSVAGRIIERITGLTYERAVQTMLLDPLELTETFLFANDIMTRRFAVGHMQSPEGRLMVARPWAMPRAGLPAGGGCNAASARDQIAWARFHLSADAPTSGQL